ncbi:glycosyltransferase family 2 protein [Mucilaginibacter dorajii]|uniref:Glycosyltransferase 2-like domain-containing protein n=1 Tax=Mucilaginibacter dorajii TaxID=692994 RepID=A0ABP7Q328_9SPHI|nr:glycosyltransferase family 2 protein [Mucilaginibacter dorajii]MCS3732761.1 glycosyltransferase involved in cell wall biosynthesis [Mucilaginibacter dorajii]
MAAGSFISIIIPTFNSARTLNACLQSITEQDYDNFEVWIIDALSTDETLALIKSYVAKFPFVNFISEADKGIYDAMNKGIDLCNGNWLYFLGSDDTFHNNKVLSAIALKIMETKADVVYGNVIMRGKNKWNLDNVIFDGEYNLEKFIDRNICHQAIFYKKSVVEKIGYYNLKYVTNADFDYNLRCYARFTFTFIDLVIANFFVGGQSSNVEDYVFKADRGALLMKYFGRRIFNKSFIGTRLYLQQAAFSKASPLNILERTYCLAAYLKQKAYAVLTNSDTRKPAKNLSVD